MIDAPFLRDRARLLHGASIAGERLERRCAESAGPTITMTVDEAREIAEQFQRVTALLTLVHLSEAMPPRTEAA